MFKSRSTGPGVRRIYTSALAIGILAALSPEPASAHFVLDSPDTWRTQDALGSPQKLGPCGNESGGTATGDVTAYQSGQTITVTIHETVFHPGHYRIALAVNNRSELPAEPVVTPGGGSPCGSVPIDPAPTFPVLADGLWAHTMPFTEPQTVEITLPADVTCAHCTLQIIEFMSSHPLNNPGGCFYHHCADISIQSVAVDDGGSDATPAADAPVDAGAAADVSPSDASPSDASGGGGSKAGCGCAIADTRGSSRVGLAALVALAALARRRGGRARVR